LLYNNVIKAGIVLSEAEKTTRQQIIEAAKAEFLARGFRAASLRQIVKNAGVTTGAFYGYFSSKEAVYAAIVEPHATAVMSRFMLAQTEFAALPKDEQPKHMGKESADCVNWTIDYMYEHYDEFKILICCNDGTPYEQFIHNMAEIEVEYTFRYMQVLRELGRKVHEPDKELCHMITSGMLNGLFEVLRHDMPKERAKQFVEQLRDFYTAGWQKIIGGASL